MTVHFWGELTRDEIRVLLPAAIVVLPTGATEQHGPHLATGHDVASVTEIAARAAALVGEATTVILAPPLAFGSSAHHLPFGGTLSLQSETYLQVVKDLLRSMCDSGVCKLLVLNGHGGNHELNEIAVRDIALEADESTEVSLAAASYWNIAAHALAKCNELQGVRVPGHAGQFETSMMLALDPTRVRTPLPSRSTDPSVRSLVPGTRVEGEVRWTSFDGFTDFPANASVETGKLVLEIVTREVAQAMLKLSTATHQAG